MRYWLNLGFLTAFLVLAGLAGAQSAPFRVKPSDIDSEVQDSGRKKEARTVVTTPKSNASSAAKDLQSIERETARATAPTSTKKPTSFKPAKETASPKINIKGSGETNAGATRVSTNSYKGRLKQKGSRGNSY